MAFEEIIEDAVPRISSSEEQQIAQGLEELRNPDWLQDLSREIERSHSGLRSPSHLALLSAVSAPLPPIPYTHCPIRSKINVLLQGPPGCGKGLIMTLLANVAYECQQMGVATSPALVGTIDKLGDWTPGKAYYSRNRVLIIRELFQSFRNGEHFQDLAWDMNELAEYPHVVSKTLASFKIPSAKREIIQQKYPGVSFPHENEFTYEAPSAIVAGMPVMGLKELYNRVTEGFVSRFVVVSINYDRQQAARASDNLWNNVLPESQEGDKAMPEAELQKCARMMRALYVTCDSEFNVTTVPSIQGYRLEKEEREVLKNETKKAMFDAWNRVVSEGSKTKDESEFTPPPFLFREEQDVLRIAVADAAARRFAGTEVEPGVIRIDRSAILTALRYLPLIVQTSVEMHVEANRIHPTRNRGTPMTFWSEYEIVYGAGPAGLSRELFDVMCREHDVNADGAAKRLAQLVEQGLVEGTADRKLVATLYRR